MVDPSHVRPAAPAVAARAWVLQHLQALVPALRRDTPAAHRLRARYVAGELGWDALCHALEAVPG